MAGQNRCSAVPLIRKCKICSTNLARSIGHPVLNDSKTGFVAQWWCCNMVLHIVFVSPYQRCRWYGNWSKLMPGPCLVKGQKMIFGALPIAATGSAFSALYPETPVPYTVPRSNFYLPGWEPGYENYALVGCWWTNFILFFETDCFQTANSYHHGRVLLPGIDW